MKKTLVTLVVLTFVFSVAGTVLAAPANPFGDVPAHHWSYDAVRQLVKNGIIDGFGDGNNQEDKSITRYQMAQMVARAIWNKDKANQADAALIAKLTTEYANELDKLGVALDQPVSKVNPAPVSKADKVTFSGDARIRYMTDGTSKTRGNKFAERFRLNMNTSINDNISFYGRFVALNHNKMGAYNYKDTDRFNVADAALTVHDFYGTDLTVGRFSQQMDLYGYWMSTTGGVDGVKLTAGNKLKITAGYANFAPYAGAQWGTTVDEPYTPNPLYSEIHNAVFTQAFYPTSKATKVGFWWLKERNGSDSKFDVRSINALSQVSPKVTLAADYGKNNIKNSYGKDPAFYHYRLTYGNVNPAKQGSWNLGLDYHKFELGVNNSIYTISMIGSVNDAKGWGILGSTVLQKNVTFSGFYGFNTKKVSTGASIDNYTRMQVDFLF